jgi:hypothetical protein
MKWNVKNGKDTREQNNKNDNRIVVKYEVGMY